MFVNNVYKTNEGSAASLAKKAGKLGAKLITTRAKIQAAPLQKKEAAGRKAAATRAANKKLAAKRAGDIEHAVNKAQAVAAVRTAATQEQVKAKTQGFQKQEAAKRATVKARSSAAAAKKATAPAPAPTPAPKPTTKRTTK